MRSFRLLVSVLFSGPQWKLVLLAIVLPLLSHLFFLCLLSSPQTDCRLRWKAKWNVNLDVPETPKKAGGLLSSELGDVELNSPRVAANANQFKRLWQQLFSSSFSNLNNREILRNGVDTWLMETVAGQEGQGWQWFDKRMNEWINAGVIARLHHCFHKHNSLHDWFPL